MNQHEAPAYTVATIGHPGNGIAIVKSQQGFWRYVESGEIVADEDFRGGWEVLGWPPGRAPQPWIKVAEGSLPEHQKVVEVLSPGGERSQLRFDSGMWWLPDGSMYVYFTPTHWREIVDA